MQEIRVILVKSLGGQIAAVDGSNLLIAADGPLGGKFVSHIATIRSNGESAEIDYKDGSEAIQITQRTEKV